MLGHKSDDRTDVIDRHLARLEDELPLVEWNEKKELARDFLECADQSGLACHSKTKDAVRTTAGRGPATRFRDARHLNGQKTSRVTRCVVAGRTGNRARVRLREARSPQNIQKGTPRVVRRAPAVSDQPAGHQARRGQIPRRTGPSRPCAILFARRQRQREILRLPAVLGRGLRQRPDAELCQPVVLIVNAI